MSQPIDIPELPDTELAEVKPIRGRFEKEGVFNVLRNFYDEDKIRLMQEKGVDSRMVFGINSYYMAIVKGEALTTAAGEEILPAMPPSLPLQRLVVPIVAEAADISGEKDPSNQMRYSPDELAGKILHKYDEIVLGYVAMACSAHCRYCYRLDLFNGSTGKGLIKAEALRDYILNHNKTLAERGGVDDKGDQRWPITEVLLSGGDAMVLSNKQLYKYLAAAAEGGVDVVRIGTKEMAFRPMRFDKNFARTLEIFHERYPGAHINLVTHFSHPDELLQRDADGSYTKDAAGYPVLLKPVAAALENMGRLPFVSMDNQTPVIKGVNDSVDALHLLHRELRRNGVSFKYIFQCREIEGHKAFAVPVEEAWRLHNQSQKGISDGGRSIFAMSTEWGKLEVVSVTGGCGDLESPGLSDDAAAAAAAIFGEGLIIMRIHRSPFAASTQGDVVIARRNPQALWISDYEDRIIYDGRQQGAGRYDSLVKTLIGADRGKEAQAA